MVIVEARWRAGFVLFGSALAACSSATSANQVTSSTTHSSSPQGLPTPSVQAPSVSAPLGSPQPEATRPPATSATGASPANSTVPAESGKTLSEKYPGDTGLKDDPSVLFHDDFETGWGRWSWPSANTQYLHLESDPQRAASGSRYLRSTVTSADLDAEEYISSQTGIDLPHPVETFYARYYAQFVGTGPTPHHWVRTTAGTPEFDGSGLANTVPQGDEGFWFDLDVDTSHVFDFYVYWYNMRSGRCNNGTAQPGCEGDQGTTYYYGNTFQPPEQTPVPHDTWVCVEIRAQVNTIGERNGELQYWIDDVPVGDYRPGLPNGTWLRDSFHTDGCEFSACTAPAPFEGFEFRSSQEVLFKTFQLDAYYQRDTSAAKRATLAEQGIIPDDAQTILYDDVVIATERIGCRRPSADK